MEIKKQEFDKFVAEIKKGMGKDFVGVADAVEKGRQFAFATLEPDRGEDVHGKWLDLIEGKLEKYGWWPKIVCMPFPVKGRLVYVLAGFRYAA